MKMGRSEKDFPLNKNDFDLEDLLNGIKCFFITYQLTIGFDEEKNQEAHLLLQEYGVNIKVIPGYRAQEGFMGPLPHLKTPEGFIHMGIDKIMDLMNGSEEKGIIGLIESKRRFMEKYTPLIDFDFPLAPFSNYNSN